MSTLVQDIRYALYTCYRQPAFTIVAVLTLAVGIGANTAMFSVVNSTLIRPLPFREPDRLMMVSLTAPGGIFGGNGRSDLVWSYPKFQTFCGIQNVFESTALYANRDYTLSGDSRAERVTAETVSASYFPLLGINAEMGRTFRIEEDEMPERDLVVLLGHSLWEQRFGRDPDITGKTIVLDTKPYTVVGVLPAGFKGLTSSAELWVPIMTLPGEDLKGRWSHSFLMVARLKSGVSAAQGKSATTVIGRQVDAAHPFPIGNGKWGAIARTMSEARIEPAIRQSVLVLFGAVGLVLLIACVNIANLLIARGTTRQREIAVRVAVGARPSRLIRQLLTESVLLSTFGAAVGLLLASWGVSTLSRLFAMPGNWIQRGHTRGGMGLSLLGLRSIQIDGNVLVFTLAAALLTGILFGLFPALQAARTEFGQSLKAGCRREDLAGRTLAGQNLLIVTEVALALVLLVGSGLMIRSLWNLTTTQTGVDTHNVMTLRVSRNLPPEQSSGPSSPGYFQELEQRISAVPGILSAALSDCVLLNGSGSRTVIWFQDRPPVPPGTEPSIGFSRVSPSYLETMRVPLIRGRWLTPADNAEAPKVAVINETAAETYWPNKDPIGKSIGLGMGGRGFRNGVRVVGVVGDVRTRQIDQPPVPDAYVSYLQVPRSDLVLFVRSAGNPGSYIAGIRDVIRQYDPTLPLYDIQSLEDRIAGTTVMSRNSTMLLGTFAFIALSLAVMGIYGVVSHSVARRTHEIGIRMALGAERYAVIKTVLARSVVLASIGVGIGLAAAATAGRVLTSLLYQVSSADPITYVVVAIALWGVALAASFVPAWRATRVDPLVALRTE